MINVDAIVDIIETALYSAYLEGEKPVSLLISAKVESGKTECVRKFRMNNGIAYLTDCTAYGITKKLLPELELGKLRHIIIPDLITPLSKSKSTVNSFVTFMSNLIEEGICEIQTYAVSVQKQGIKCGLITTIAREYLEDKRHRWNQVGFLSRMLPVSYAYSTPTIQQILSYIADEKYHSEASVKLKFPKKNVFVVLDSKFSKDIMPLTYDLARASELYGFRYQKQLQCLMKAHALKHGRKTVIQKDADKVLDYSRYFNLKYPEI